MTEDDPLRAFIFDPDPGELPEYRPRRSIRVSPELFAMLVDRACQLSEQAIGRPPDRRKVAEAVAAWARVLR